MKEDIREIAEAMERQGYVADRAIATAVHLARSLGKPLLVEGEAGVGKTEIAKVLAAVLGTELIRLQCYEGLDVNTALYEWNYPKQLLRIRLEGLRWEPQTEGAGESDRAGEPGPGAGESGPATTSSPASGVSGPATASSPASGEDLEHLIFGPEYLMERPLLQAISRERPPVLLIDEIDRADEEFEAFLLELLSDFQVSIPELGTIRAKSRPHVVLTSNSTRELSDALRRRCLYLWIDYPTFEKELRILRARLPSLTPGLDEEIVRFVHRLRAEKLFKTPGVAETLDWAGALGTIGVEALDAEVIRSTLGCLIKDRHDFQKLSRNGFGRLLEIDPSAATRGGEEDTTDP
ncbi:MAG: AAA family ATPase [Gemmatimonadota bacterium]